MKKLKIYILALISIAILNSCGTPVDPQEVVNSQKLKSETKWQCNPDSKAKLFKVSYKEYTLEGKLLKSINYNDFGVAASVSEIAYNDDEMIETENFIGTNGTSDSTVITTSKFDLTGKKVSLIESNLKGDTLSYSSFVYDNSGNLVKKIELNSSTSKVSEVVYKNIYNDQGQIVERLQDVIENNQFSTKEFINYLPDENKIRKITTDSFGSIININTYTFNGSGKIVIETIADNTGKVKKYFTYEYSYF